MKLRIIQAVAATAASLLLAGAVMAASNPLEDLRWKHRLLIVFAQGDEARERAQRDALPAGALDERDIVLVAVPKTGDATVPGLGRVPGAGVRTAYGVAPDAPFTVLLVGKDGGTKLRSSEPIAARELFGTVDAMPMRQQEMRKR